MRAFVAAFHPVINVLVGNRSQGLVVERNQAHRFPQIFLKILNFLQFVRPVLRKMMGDPKPFLPVLRAEIRNPVRRRPDRPEMVRVRLQHDGEQLWAEVVGHQGSSNLPAMAEAHGFAMIDADVEEPVSATHDALHDDELEHEPQPGDV